MSSTKKICLLLVGAAVIYSPVFAQKKQFTIAEATNGMATTLAPKGLKNASWQPGTNKLWVSDKKNDADIWKVSDLADEKNLADVEQGQYPEKIVAIPAIKWLDKDNAYFVNGRNVLLGNIATGKWSWSSLATLPEKAESVAVDKKRYIAYVLDNNLYLYANGKGPIAVTSEPNKNIVNGRPVHRDEFGIDRGIFFSPNANYIAYYRMDQTMVKDYPIIKWDVTPATVDIIKYPMAGGPSHEVTLCVYNIATGKTVTMKTGSQEKDHYLTSVTWSPDEKSIYIAILNRGQNHLSLNQYNTQTGEKEKTLFEEKDPKYVHPMHPMTFVPGHDDEFVWWSERDGHNHLYLYNTTGKQIRQLTHGDWEVNEIAGINATDNKLIITAAKESPLEKHIYTVSIDNGQLNRLDKDPGMHTATCSPDGKYVLDVYSAAGIPKNTYVYGTSGGFTKELLKADNTLAGYDRPEIKSIIMKANDGKTDLYGKLILPVNFDKTKKYPVIVYLYNGPNVQLLHNSYPESGNLWYEYMAQHGYIVFTMDGRGSSNRGKAFEQATFRHLGDVEIEDQLTGVAYLKSLPYVDSKRMGIHGWSYGGFMTTSIMLKHPAVFKCAVAGGPVMDWKMYEVMYTERYMDRPEENPEGYANADLLTKVKNLQGKLLLIHGTNDFTVVWQHSIDFLKKCVDEGVQVDYFVYPGYEHNVRGKDRAHLMQKVSDYFDLYLKP